MIKKKKEIPLDIPQKMDVDSWLVVGLDPSLSSTGYAMMKVTPGPGRAMVQTCTDAAWLAAGSVRPETAADPIWVRSKMIGVHIREMVSRAYDQYVYQTLADHKSLEEGTVKEYTAGPGDQAVSYKEKMGLILSLEFPTPMDDYLVALNRILHLTLFETDMWKKFAHVRVLMTNASTLRSLMGLFKKGNNKGENIARAYDFISKEGYPQLDSDACDAVLLAMVARHVASILLGFPDSVPGNFKTSLCNAEKGTKGAGRNIKVITKGILHRPEYWYQYERREYALKIRDAASLKKQLIRETYTI
jgi:hypothetical protein